jgi:lysophospholipase L1-like esterase
MLRNRIVLGIFTGLALVLVTLALQLSLPGETLERSGPGEARVLFSADRKTVFAPGSCLTLRWQADNIREIYLNNVPAVGQDVRILCLNGGIQPTLRLVFEDSSIAEYTLPVEFLVEQPATWLLLGAAVLLLLAALYALLFRSKAAAPNAPPVSRASRFFAAIGIVFTVLLLTAVVLELAARFYFTQYGTRAEKIAYVYSQQEVETALTETVLLPYLEYGLSAEYPGHNHLGYRGETIEVPKPLGVYRIVVLGGSATYGTTAPYDEAYPYYLQQVLREEYGYLNVEVVNGGVAGYTSWHTLVDLAFRVTELQPDLVLLYNGLNDIAAREMSPDCYSGETPYLGLNPNRTLRAQLGERSPFVLYRLFATYFRWTPPPGDPHGLSVYSPIGCDYGTGDVAANVAANPPTFFERNMREMIAITQVNDIRIMLSTVAYDQDSSETEAYWRAAMAQHNDITTALATEFPGVLYYDYAAVAENGADYWNDFMHRNAEGNLLQARAYAAYLVEQGVIPE